MGAMIETCHRNLSILAAQTYPDYYGPDHPATKGTFEMIEFVEKKKMADFLSPVSFDRPRPSDQEPVFPPLLVVAGIRLPRP